MASVGRAKMCRLLIFGLAVFLAAISFSCKSSPTAPHITGNVQLSADYVACTEVWLKISVTNNFTGGQFKITRDGDTVLTGSLSGADTVIIDTTAQAERTYTYRGYRLKNDQVSDTSLQLQVRTMDTTSNNLTWQTFTFGGNAGSCILKDVAIINDTSTWAVGEVSIKDSSVNGYSIYNLVKWDGRGWQLDSVAYYSQGQPFYTTVSSIFAIDERDVWLDPWHHWDGQNFQYLASDPIFFGVGIDRMWGNSGGIYVVGTGGFVAHMSTGQVWTRLVNNTNLDIQDVWGIESTQTGQEEVPAVACDKFSGNGIAVMQLSSTGVTSVQTDGLPPDISGVWSADGREWYVCGDGLYKARNMISPWQRIINVPSIYKEAIRGSGPNDIFAVGDFGLVLHFNGSTWTDLSQEVNIPNSVLYAVSVKGNTVVAVGQTVSGSVGGAALILVGNRN